MPSGLIWGRRVLAFILIVAPAAAFAASGPSPVLGTWRPLPPAPIAVWPGLASVWTGSEMLVFGRVSTRSEDGAILASVNVAAAYDPSAHTWRRLAPPAGPTSGFVPGRYSAAWTGSEMLVWGPGTAEAFNPRSNRWRQLPPAPADAHGHQFGLVVWTGRELIGWGGGCCGDAFSDGVAYDRVTNAWRRLPPSPLAGSQSPTGAWTGRELVMFVGGFDPDGNAWPARLARAAAYNPTTNRWRRLMPLPEPRVGAHAVWDGREVLVVGGAGAPHGGRPPALATIGFAYNPATNRWRRLPRMESLGRTGAAAVWTGRRLLVWGGQRARGEIPAHGLAYDPKANRWSALPPAPVLGRADPAAAWTGRELIVWGSGDSFPPFADGAAFTPAPP